MRWMRKFAVHKIYFLYWSATRAARRWRSHAHRVICTAVTVSLMSTTSSAMSWTWRRLIRTKVRTIFTPWSWDEPSPESRPSLPLESAAGINTRPGVYLLWKSSVTQVIETFLIWYLPKCNEMGEIANVSIICYSSTYFVDKSIFYC